MPAWSKAGARLRLLSVIVLGACAEDPTGAPVVEPIAAGQAAQQVLGPAGGSLVLATAEGATLTVIVPAGALDSATTLRVETAEVAPGQRFHLRFLPEGLVFADGERATVRIQLPASVPLSSDLVLGYDGALVPFTRGADGILEVRLAHFAESATAAVPAAMPAAMPAATAQPACGGVPQLGDFAIGGLSDAELSSAAAYGQCMVGAVQALAASGAYLDAVNLANTTAMYLQSVGTGDPSGFVAQAKQITCTAYRAALDHAIATPVTSMGQLHALVRPLLFWESAVMQLGAQCAQIQQGEYQTVIAAKAAQAAAAYTASGPQLATVESAAYAEAITEVREQETTVRQVRSLQPPAALTEVARQAMEEIAQPALLSAMLQAPWRRCREAGQYDRLIELMALMDGPAAVKQAAHQCGVQVMARSLDAAGTTETAHLALPLGGVDATTVRASGTLFVRADGQLRVLGPIRTLQCPSGVAVGDERIELRIDGHLVDSHTGPIVAVPELSLSMPALLAVAGIASADFQQATLTIVRAGASCGGYWGPAPESLATITLMALAGPSVQRFEGGGTYRAVCGITRADRDWASGMTVWLTTLADGTRRIVARSPWEEAVSGYADFVRVADRTDPEIEDQWFEITPISAAAGDGTTYTANWVSHDGVATTHALTLVTRAGGAATLSYTATYSTSCADGEPATTTSYGFTFSGMLVP